MLSSKEETPPTVMLIVFFSFKPFFSPDFLKKKEYRKWLVKHNQQMGRMSTFEYSKEEEIFLFFKSLCNNYI
jgi:hypothetical protein